MSRDYIGYYILSSKYHWYILTSFCCRTVDKLWNSRIKQGMRHTVRIATVFACPVLIPGRIAMQHRGNVVKHWHNLCYVTWDQLIPGPLNLRSPCEPAKFELCQGTWDQWALDTVLGLLPRLLKQSTPASISLVYLISSRRPARKRWSRKE